MLKVQLIIKRTNLELEFVVDEVYVFAEAIGVHIRDLGMAGGVVPEIVSGVRRCRDE